MMNFRRLAVFPAMLVMLVGCSSVPEKQAVSDNETNGSPVEFGSALDTYNEGMHSFNTAAQEWVFAPIGTAIDFVLPDIVEESIGSVLENLTVPNTAINNALQGKFTEAGQDLGRFTINSTIGLLGLIDFASMMDIPKNEEDLGQTLAVYGVDSGPYIVMPIFGGMTPRDMAGFALSFDPVNMTSDEFKDIVDNMGYSQMFVHASNNEPMTLAQQKEMFNAFRQCSIYDGGVEAKASCDLVCGQMSEMMQADLDQIDDIEEQREMIEMASNFLPSYCNVEFKTH